MISPFLSGFGVGAGLIIAIGAQNAFVLGQGLRREHHLMVACICAFSDALLITIGVTGLGQLVALNDFWAKVLTGGAILFLSWYGFLAARNVFTKHHLKAGDRQTSTSWRKILMVTLAVTFLNPHVYLDTVLLIGSVATPYQDESRTFFAFGAISASFVWFFTLGIGAAICAPYLARPVTWKIVDALTACVMWAIAISLLRSF